MDLSAQASIYLQQLRQIVADMQDFTELSQEDEVAREQTLLFFGQYLMILQTNIASFKRMIAELSVGKSSTIQEDRIQELTQYRALLAASVATILELLDMQEKINQTPTLSP